jgi:hypothetical protein
MAFMVRNKQGQKGTVCRGIGAGASRQCAMGAVCAWLPKAWRRRLWCAGEEGSGIESRAPAWWTALGEASCPRLECQGLEHLQA